jgi:hypothetical protein
VGRPFTDMASIRGRRWFLRGRFLVITDKRMLLFKESIMGRPKGILLSEDRLSVKSQEDFGVLGWSTVWIRLPDGRKPRLNFTRFWREEASQVVDLLG